KQVHTTVWMRAIFITAKRRRTQNFAKPTQIIGSRKTLGHARRPTPAKPFYFVPTLFPMELRENLSRLLKKFREGRFPWQKLDFLESKRDHGFVLRTRACFPEDFDVIDEHVSVGAAQFLFDFENRHLVKNGRICGAEKSKKGF